MAGHIITIIGGKGGVGKSMVAANLAFSFAAEMRQKVLLLDFDSKAAGDQNIITGIKARKTLKDLAEFSGAIDPKSFSQFVTPHPQNVHFLGMPPDVIAAEGIDAGALGKTLKAVKSIYPITIIDAGANLDALALKALEFSMILLVPPDILAVNQSKRTLSELLTMLFPKEMVFLIMNQGQKVTQYLLK